MKNLTSILIIFSILVTACGKSEESSVQKVVASGNLEEIKEKKNSLIAEQKALQNQISRLDSVINSKDTIKKYPLISVVEAKKQDFQHYLELQGEVQTKQNVLIHPEVAGTLLKVYVTEGQRVQQGQLLATIDNGGMASQLQQQKTQLSLAETTFERQKNLWDQKIGTEIQFLQAKTNFEAQKDAVKQMESNLAKYQIRAPFSGIIDDVIKEEGTVVSPGPGSEIFRLVNLSNMYVQVPVPETYINDITTGKDVKVYFPVLGDTVDTKVRQTGNFIDPGNRSFSVEVGVPNKNGNIKPNLTAKVQINDYTNDDAILIPQSIISENAEGEQYAYLAVNIGKDGIGTAKRSIITTGKAQGDYIEVLSGIEAGQSIITEGARNVRDDQKVQIIKSKL